MFAREGVCKLKGSRLRETGLLETLRGERGGVFCVVQGHSKDECMVIAGVQAQLNETCEVF